MCPISFNIYGKKLNERHFPSGTVIIYFWDKPYQERKNTVRFERDLFDFNSLYLFVLTFGMKLKDANYKLEYFIIFQPMKNDFRFEYAPWKNI